MVFLSTCQVLLGRNPFGVTSATSYSPPRSVFTTFGTRRLTQRMAVEEIAAGLFVVVPLSLMVAFFAKRFAASGFLRPAFVRRDVWTTLVITIVGDLFLELLLPSLQCLPTEHPFDSYSSSSSSTTSASPGGYFSWLLRAWGFQCPAEPYTTITSYRDEYHDDPYYDDPNNAYYYQHHQDPATVLSTDAVGTLLTLRLIFMCVGVYLGESFCPVVLTGGIACGKSTVGRMLVANNSSGGGGSAGAGATAGAAGDIGDGGDDGFGGAGGAPSSPGHSMAGPYKTRRGGGPASKRGGAGKQANKRPKSAASELDGLSSNPASTSSGGAAAAAAASYDDGEGSVLIVDTDKIAHQILLPPSVLGSGGGQQPLERGNNWNVIGGAGGGSSSNLSFSHDDSHEIDGDDMEEDDDFEDDDDDNGSNGALHPSSSATSPTRRQQQQLNRNRRRSRRQPSRRRVRYVVSAADSVYDKVVDAFGDESVNCRNILTPDGMIDRDRLGALVFGNRELRRRLNAITHPRIFVTMMRQLVHGSYFSPQDIVCADIPLFFETMSGLRRMFGLVVVVACSKEVQFQRLRKRNPDLTAEQCWERINSQLPISEKAELADVVIWNNGSVEDLEQEVERVRKEVVGRLYGIGMSLLQMLLLVGGSLSLAVSSKLFTSFSA
jgi:dephospho-CoA kinase